MKIRDVLHCTEPKGFVIHKEASDGLWFLGKTKLANGSVEKWSVITSVLKYSDDKFWLHVSFANMERMPTYEEQCYFKRLFIGPEKKALAVFPPESEHVNDHEFCLHLWHCVDADPTPDFRIKGTI